VKYKGTFNSYITYPFLYVPKEKVDVVVFEGGFVTFVKTKDIKELGDPFNPLTTKVLLVTTGL
jgi:hypothetical protein